MRKATIRRVGRFRIRSDRTVLEVTMPSDLVEAHPARDAMRCRTNGAEIDEVAEGIVVVRVMS
jgi:hypothetical protein